MTPKLQGIVVPLLTPFSRDPDAFDETAYRRLIDHVIGAGVHAVIANAATSEFNSLDEAERERAAEVAVEHAAGRVPVLVGAGSPTTRHSIRWARHAEKIGAQGLLVMPPYYGTCPTDGIVRHYAEISRASSLPIMLYNAPYAAHVLLTPGDVERIAREANVPWVKLTTGVLEHVTQIRARMGDRIAIFEGVDSLAFPSMALGSCGWVAGTANMIPELAVELWRLTHVAGDLAAARALHERIDPLHELSREAGIYFALGKEVCRLRGIPLGAVRLPWPDLSEDQRRRAHALARGLGLMPGTGSRSA
jgi:dihydrodipicolinate synthase/N-acetylneuraminate lyase